MSNTGVVDPGVLAQVSLFAELDLEELQALAAGLQRRRFLKGQPIFLQGDSGTSLYLVESGRVKISATSPEGKALVLNVLGPGDFFGELALLDGEPRSADAIAQEACQLLRLQREHFQHVLETRASVAIKLLAVVSRRLRRTTQQAEDVAFLDVPARLARVLLTLAESEGRPDGQGAVMITSRLTQAELAELVGTTRESVNKWLGAFERQGLIRRSRSKITVLQPDALRARID